MRITIPNSFPKETEAFIDQICDDLSLEGLDIELAPLTNDKLGTLDNLNGCLIDLDNKNFLVMVRLEGRVSSQIMFTIAHEIMHIRQHIKDNLGELLNSPFDYTQCWWEKQANDYGWYAIRTHLNK